MRPKAWRYGAGFALALLLAAWLLPWRNGDWALFTYLPRGESVHLEEARISVIDLDYSKDEAVYRARVAALLRHLASGAAGKPDAVVLDIQFQAKPDTGLQAVADAVRALQKSRGEADTKVYAAVYLIDELQPSRLNPNFMDLHARELYVQVLDGFGHTAFQRRQRTLMYEAYSDVGKGVVIPSLPALIAERHHGLEPGVLRGPQLLDLGPEAEVDARTLRFEQGHLVHASGAARAVNLDRHVVILGSPRNDLNDPAGAKGRDGPELLVWAIAARARNADNTTAAEVLASPWLLLAVTALLSPLSAWATRRAAARWRSLRSGESWATPLAGVLAGVLGLLAVSAFALLARHAYVQWTLVLLACTLASVFTWRLLVDDLRWARLHLEERRTPRQYDVFISYSRTPPDNAAWVETQIVEPLKKATRPDGTRLKVFFDKESIQAGQEWQVRVASDIYQSHVFVAVYSEEYFSKKVCLYEIKEALRVHISEAANELPFIVPVLRDKVDVPRAFSSINYLSPAQSGFEQTLVARVKELVAVRHARTVAQVAPDLKDVA